MPNRSTLAEWRRRCLDICSLHCWRMVSDLIFYGAYIVAVPILVTLTDRIDAKQVYLGGVAATVLGHLLFALLADGFRSDLLRRLYRGGADPSHTYRPY